MPRRKRVRGGRAHDRSAAGARERIPKRANSARVRLCRHHNYGGASFPLQFRCNHRDLISRIVYRWLEHPDCIRWDALVHQNSGVEEVFTYERNVHFLQ
jgi:hypothetical protein